MELLARRLGSLLLLVALLGFPPGGAHAFTWESIGPRGGGARMIAVDANPTTLYAVGTETGLYRSHDGGATWSGGPGPNVVGIASDPSTPGTAFAAIAEYDFCSHCFFVTLHILKTTDGGETWSGTYSEELGSGIPLGQGTGYERFAVAVDPSNPQIVHVGGMLRSIDGGATWTEIPDPTFASAIVVDPTDSQVVYAVPLGFAGIFKSTDGGNTYVNAAANLAPHAPVSTVALDAATGDLYIAGTTVYRSVDGAASWTPTGASFPTGVNALAARDGVVWVGTRGIFPANPFVVGSAGSVFRSPNAGATWTERAAGIPHVPGVGSSVDAIALAPDPYVAWAGTVAGVYRTDSDGLDWRPPLNGLRQLPVLGVATHPLAPTTIIAATEHGVFRSEDRGASWTPIVNGLATLEVRVLEMDPQTPATMYAINGNLGTTSTAAVSKTTDGGVTWTVKTGGNNLAAIAIDPVTPSVVYVAHPGALFKSTNGLDAFTVTFPPSFTARALVIDPTAPLTIYGGGFAGVAKSPDGGASWPSSNAGLTDLFVTDLVMDPQDPLRLYTVNGTAGVFTSDDGAASWSPTGALAGNQSTAVVNPSTAAVYVGGDSGVFEAPAGGGAWALLGTGLALDFVRGLAVEPGARALYAAGTVGFGGLGGDLKRLQLVACTTAADCDDSNACTADACDVPSGTCSNTALADGAPCTDGDACTIDLCTAGACRSTLDVCSLCADPADFDDDGVNDICDPVGCLAPADCDDLNSCTSDACDAGTCTSTPLADGTPCTDGDVCTIDVCTAGACDSTLDPCSLCADPDDWDNDGVNDVCDPNVGSVAIKSAKIVRNPTNGSVTAKGTIVLGPGNDPVSSAGGLELRVTAGGFAATATWAAAHCKVSGTRFACTSPDRRWRLKVRPTSKAPTEPRFSAKIRGLSVGAVPGAPVTVEIEEVGAAITRAGSIGSCIAKTSALVCRAP